MAVEPSTIRAVWMKATSFPHSLPRESEENRKGNEVDTVPAAGSEVVAAGVIGLVPAGDRGDTEEADVETLSMMKVRAVIVSFRSHAQWLIEAEAVYQLSLQSDADSKTVSVLIDCSIFRFSGFYQTVFLMFFLTFASLQFRQHLEYLM